MMTNMLTYTLLIAHGSRDPRWQEPFESLMERLKQQEASTHCGLCYMEMCEPTAQQHLSTVNMEAYRTVRILPLFMAAGAHVAHEIEDLRHALIAQYPHLLEVEVLPPIGEHALVQAAMETVVVEAL